MTDYANDVLRRMAGRAKPYEPFATSILRLLDELEEARAYACHLEAWIAAAELRGPEIDARPGYARIRAGDTPEDIDRKLDAAFAPARALVEQLRQRVD